MKQRKRWRFVALFLAVGLGTLGLDFGLSGSAGADAQTLTTPQPSVQLRSEPYSTYIHEQTETILKNLQETGDFVGAENSLDQLFQQAIAWVDDDDINALSEVDLTFRLISGLGQVQDASHRMDLLNYLLANRELAATLAILVEPDKQNVPDIYNLLYRMHHELGSEPAEYPDLTAAICAVLYQPLGVDINENHVQSADPVALFKFYVNNQDRMFFGIRDMPAELLVYVVDSHSSIQDLQWALDHFHGNPLVGQLFFSIKYDENVLYFDATKKVDQVGYTLPNIYQYGGVCADQAFFASEVGKAIGVPTSYDTGISSVTGHAWVGFLEADQGRGWWNFTIGRYAEYQGVIGRVIDPLSRQVVPDSFISLSAQLIGTTQRQRQNAVALTDAAIRLIATDFGALSFTPDQPPANIIGIRQNPRQLSTETELDFLWSAVEQCNGYAGAWDVVRYLASQGKLSLRQKYDWADNLMQLCGSRYPEFAMDILTPMVQTVSDVNQQNELWNRMYTIFSEKRFDLAACVRMYQADMWEKAGNDQNAGECLLDVVNQYANAGPYVIDALQKAEQILIKEGNQDRVVTLYEQAWAKIVPPPQMAAIFVEESNWYQVGSMLAQKLKDAGQISQANQVASELAAATTRVAAQ
ncbi:MAG TPA: hypothetical protein VMG59_11180 [Phycisphaerae bacterium]|nr:hypothetical protein [Phycisphaerae bacterium]